MPTARDNEEQVVFQLVDQPVLCVDPNAHQPL